MSSYVVQTEVFEGPLDLLLSLIEKRKLFINDISLAKVADDFINYIDSHEKFQIGETADFLLVASTLLLIKSKSLLPTLELEPEEEESIESLERRLKLYKVIKEVAGPLREQFGTQIMFEREYAPSAEPIFAPHNAITLEAIHDAMTRILANLPKEEKLTEAKVKQVVSIEEMVTRLSDRINKNIQMSFREFSQMGKEDRVTVVVSFLAMLELVKLGTINVRQDSAFSDIMMESERPSTPRYL